MKKIILFLALAVGAFAQAPAVRGNVNASSVQGIPSGTSPVGTTGIAATQVAYGSAANTIKGSSQLIFVEGDSQKISSAVVNGLQIYNTADQTTNYERLSLSWSSNVARIETMLGGTGAARDLQFVTAGSGHNIRIRAVNPTAGIFTFTAAASATPSTIAHQLTVGSNTATSGNNIGLAISPTYNQASGTANNTDLLINRTQTAVQAATTQLFIDAQVGAVSQFSVSNQGGISVKSNANGRAGTFVLVAGTVTVANTSVTANSVIEFTVKTVGGTIGAAPQVVSTVVGTSFTVTGTGTNTSTYNYIIKEIIP